MKRSLLLLILAGLMSTAQAQGHLMIEIAPDSAATLEVFLPAEPNGQGVVCCPGGGYSHLSYQNEGTDWAAFFNDLGIAFCVLKYRMPAGDRSLPMEDACEAVRQVRQHAEEWGVDPKRVGIMGFSAGGHLASTTATHAPGEAMPDFQILFYPVISMVEADTHKGSVVNFLGDGRSDETLVSEFTNWQQVTPTSPPAIILLSSDDKAVPPLTNGLPYYEALVRQGVSATLAAFPTGGHGWGFKSTFPYHDEMLGLLSRWISEE